MGSRVHRVGSLLGLPAGLGPLQEQMGCVGHMGVLWGGPPRVPKQGGPVGRQLRKKREK